MPVQNANASAHRAHEGNRDGRIGDIDAMESADSKVLTTTLIEAKTHRHQGGELGRGPCYFLH
jgi:hypothetical protein